MAQSFADSLDYFDELKNTGVPEDQARVHVKIVRQNNEAQSQFLLKEINNNDKILRAELATKNDIQDLRVEIQSIRNDLSKEIQSVREDFTKEIQEVRNMVQLSRLEAQQGWNSLMRWGVTAMIAQTALLIAVIGAGMTYLAK